MGFPTQLKLARFRLDYTQQQVADLLGVDVTTYCCYEIGKRQPDLFKLAKLSEILQTPCDVLLETSFGDTFYTI